MGNPIDSNDFPIGIRGSPCATESHRQRGRPPTGWGIPASTVKTARGCPHPRAGEGVVNRNGNEGEGYVRGQAQKRSLGSTGGKGGRHALLLAFMVLLGSLVAAVTVASAAAPLVTMGSVSNVGYTVVDASGEVDPEGEPVEYWFEVSTDETNWERKNVSNFSSEPEPQTLSGTINGLQPETHYYVRIAAFNYNEGIQTNSPAPYPEFTTLGPVPKPTVTIDPVTTFSGSTATFSGKIDPGAAQSDPGFNVNWHFECEPGCQSLSNGGGEFADDGTEHTVETEASIEPNTEYTIKLVAGNTGGSESDETTFKSTAVGPVVETIPAFAFGDGTKALIGGKVNPKNSATKYWLEYGPGPGGPSPTYPTSIPVDHEASAGSGNELNFVTQELSGLTPASTYHFRLVAESAAGTSEGEDISFKTLAPPAPLAGNCPNEKLRSESNSEALDDCRAYEMVSPVDKNGGDATQALTSSPDGNRFAFYSTVAFSGAPANNGISAYVAQRGPDGWVTIPMGLKVGSGSVGGNGYFYNPDFTEDLSQSIATSRVTAGEPNVANVFATHIDGSVTWISAPAVAESPIFPKAYSGRSADGSHVIFESAQQFDPQHITTGSQVWEWVNGTVRLVSVLPDGSVPPQGAGVGSGINGSVSKNNGFNGTLINPDAVSDDGSRIFFGIGGSGLTNGVFVRIDGVETRELSLSQRTGSIGQPAPSASFLGAASDGSRVVFSSADQLTDAATPNGGVYAFDLKSGILKFLSAGATEPAGAQVEGIARISQDATHVYFVARSVLVPGKGRPGGHNLYVSGPNGVAFIATLGDDDGQNWDRSFGNTGGDRTAKTTPDGRFFVFQSWERLTAFDNAGHEEVYLYDSERGTISCVSCGVDAGAANGDASIIENPLPRGGSLGSTQVGRVRTIASDGSSVFFQSTDALVAADVNGRSDVYEFDSGSGAVSLLSSGVSNYPSEIAGNSPDGRDVYFFTRDSLVARDTDHGSKDIYDARVDGGFAAPQSAGYCDGTSTCQQQPPSAAEFRSPASQSPSRGNPKPKPRCRPKGNKKRNRHCRGKNRKRHATHKRNTSDHRRAS